MKIYNSSYPLDHAIKIKSKFGFFGLNRSNGSIWFTVTFINFSSFCPTYTALSGTAHLFIWIEKSYLHVYLDLHNYDFRLKSVQKLAILNRNFRKLPSEWCNTQGASLQVNFQIQNSKNPINSRSFSTLMFI